MNASFYGGKPGTPFIISKGYTSYSQMVSDFSKGASFTEVAFGEYVLITTESKSDSYNGALYRRGTDYTNSAGGAIYLGSIVGPAGKAPLLGLATLDEIKEKESSSVQETKKTEGVFNLDNASLVPGKTDSGTFNDEIEWASLTIRDELGAESVAWVGFKIPYPVIDFTFSRVEGAYSGALVTRVDDKSHPFYNKWNIAVPRGVKGDTFKNFRVIQATSTVENYTGQGDDITNKRDILVYDYYCYDEADNPTAKTIYLGDYNMIDNITLADDGTFTIDYTHDSSKIYSKKIRWITSVNLNSETGLFKINFNDSTDYSATLKWINDIDLADNGEVTISYTTGTTKKLTNSLRWITGTSFTEDGTFIIFYNDNSQEQYLKQVKWVTGVSLTAEGIFTIEFNNGDSSYTTNIIYPTSIAIDSETDEKNPGSQKLRVVYNNGMSQEIGEPLNYIMRTAINPINYHLLVLYSSPAMRPIDGVTFEGVEGWKDLGAIKDADGVLMGLYLDETKDAELKNLTTTEVISYLNEKYPEGAQNDNKGKIATVAQESLDTRKFFAYDYDTSSWKYVGSFEGMAVAQIAAIRKTDSNFNNTVSALSNGGICLIIEDS